jgi:hypothetical protein
MSKDDKSRESPLAHLGLSGIARRFAPVSTEGASVDSQAPFKGVPSPRERAVEVTRKPGDRIKKAKAALAGAKSKGGRPATVGKPWEALGISRAAYYKRQKKEKPE